MRRHTQRAWPVAATLMFIATACAHTTPSPAGMPLARDRAGTVATIAGVPSSTLPQAEEIQAGRDAAGYVRNTVGLVDDPRLQGYVQHVGAAVAAHCERPDLPWYFAVLDDPAPNAFALPGGVIFVTRGMLSHLDSEAELASLLGHEIAHVAARHSIQVLGQLAFPRLGDPLAAPATPVAAGAHLDGGIGLMFRQYGRQAERQADALGFGYALAAGYDVHEMEDIFIVLERRERQLGVTRPPEFLATHPTAEERVAIVRDRLADVAVPADLRVGRDDFLERIDGLVYGPDPRNGFFQGTRFFHFAQRFVIRLPNGWMARNLGRVVVASSPDNDAMIHFGVVDATPEAAERRLLELPGVVGHLVSTDPIDGLEARVLTFRIETEAGAREGLAAFIAHDGRTHEILGLATSARFGVHGLDIVAAISSFAALRDDALEAVQPLRLRVERIPEAMTVAAFAGRYQSALAVDELVILNQADDGGTRFARGTLVKRVAGGR